MINILSNLPGCARAEYGKVLQFGCGCCCCGKHGICAFVVTFAWWPSIIAMQSLSLDHRISKGLRTVNMRLILAKHESRYKLCKNFLCTFLLEMHTVWRYETRMCAEWVSKETNVSNELFSLLVISFHEVPEWVVGMRHEERRNSSASNPFFHSGHQTAFTCDQFFSAVSNIFRSFAWTLHSNSRLAVNESSAGQRVIESLIPERRTVILCDYLTFCFLHIPFVHCHMRCPFMAHSLYCLFSVWFSNHIGFFRSQ